MRTHPVFLRLEGRRCVVVGGDAVAAGKAAACLRAGASVRLVASTLSTGAAALVEAGSVEHLARDYRDGDLAGSLLAYASTRDPSVVRALVAEAEREGVLLNVVDLPDACGFFSPAVVERGDLRVAIGTGGASPGLAAELRRELEGRLGPEYGPFVAILDAVRRVLAASPGRGDVLNALVASPLLDLVRRRERQQIDALLARLVTTGCTLDRLGVTLEERAA